MKKTIMLSALLCFSVLLQISTQVSAAEQEIPAELTDKIAEEISAEINLFEITSSVYDGYVTKSIDSNQLPATYDLRDQGLVTPVKFQNPFGTCWAFGTIAASEISILSELGETCEEFAEKYGFEFDLSERQLAYFAHKAVPETDSEEFNNQGGEGVYFVNEYNNKEMTGGLGVQAGDIFAEGTGPVFESEVPYQGKAGLTDSEEVSGGQTVVYYSDEDDWSVSEEYRKACDFDLVDCSELICPANLDEDGNYSYNPYGTYDIKCALYDGYGVDIAFCADDSMPGEPSVTAYMNTEGENPTWAHYTYEVEQANHEVCIVGWDDNYPASNFTEGHQPPADGAWIVKNSWGSLDSDEMNTCNWGYEGSGYFYLSYYDQSLATPTIFDFDVSRFLGEGTEQNLKEYDYTTTNVLSCVPFEEEVASANIFTAEENSSLQAISVCTRDYDTSIVYMIYRLTEDSENPEDGTLLTTKSVQFEHAGTHKITLDSSISCKKGDRIAVVVKNVKAAEDGTLNYTLRVNSVYNEEGALAYAVPTNTESYNETNYQKAVINAGESYVLFQGNWYDWKDVADLVTSQDNDCRYVDIDNFTIKAYF